MMFLFGYLQSPCYRQSLSKTSTPKMHRFFVKKRVIMIEFYSNPLNTNLFELVGPYRSQDAFSMSHVIAASVSKCIFNAWFCKLKKP